MKPKPKKNLYLYALETEVGFLCIRPLQGKVIELDKSETKFMIRALTRLLPQLK